MAHPSPLSLSNGTSLVSWFPPARQSKVSSAATNQNCSSDIGVKLIPKRFSKPSLQTRRCQIGTVNL